MDLEAAISGIEACQTIDELKQMLQRISQDYGFASFNFLDTGATQADDANVRRELRWYWRDHGFPRPSIRERLTLERHNAHCLRRQLREFRPDVVSWWSMGGMSLSMLEIVREERIPAVAFVHAPRLNPNLIRASKTHFSC